VTLQGIELLLTSWLALPTLPQAIESEVKRLEELIPENERKGMAEKEIAFALEGLRPIPEDLAQGKVYVAFERLASFQDILESAAFLTQHQEEVQDPKHSSHFGKPTDPLSNKKPPVSKRPDSPVGVHWSRAGEIVGIAVGSKEEDVRGLLAEIEGAPSDSVMGEDELVAKFGPVLAVPTLMVFGPDGKTAEVFYGAPPDLHERVKRLVEELSR